jgi:imidazolonepropionase-like amidohydrolase
METQDVKMENAAILNKAGVKVVIRADESYGIGNIRELPLLAAFAVKSGLERDEALRAITLNAAEVSGVAGRIGSLDTGKDADLVIFSGDPFHYRTRVERVMINGETVFAR